MGYHLSKSKKKTLTGDEAAALEIIRTLPFKTQRLLHMNKGLGIQYDYHTLLHLAALRGMPNLVSLILEDFGGDPNWLEDNVGKFSYLKFAWSKELKTDTVEKDPTYLNVLLEWRARMIEQYGDETYWMEGNNAIDAGLHLAAADGIINCVEELIKSGISPFVVKKDCMALSGDADEESGYYCTALMLDHIMTVNKEVRDEERTSLKMREDDESCFSFDFNMIAGLMYGNLEDTFALRSIEKLLAKCNIKVSMITEYYRERLSIKWTTDLISCFKRAGITVSQYTPGPRSRTMLDPILNNATNGRYVLCPLCMMTIIATSRPITRMKCGHNFCSPCWQTYLTEQIDQEYQASILCPIYNCKVLVPSRVVEGMVTADLVQKYRSLKLMALINSGNLIKWCPAPNCGLAVRLSVPNYWKRAYTPLEQIGLVPSRAVECGNGHSFCWECLDSCHAPMPCDRWQMWLKRAREHDPDSISKKIKECAETVNHLWITEQSKVCPMCRAPTRGNVGCKYLTCTQCGFIFRYICLGVCEIRPTLTGGLAECVTPNEFLLMGGKRTNSNRHEESSVVDEASRSGHFECPRNEEDSDVDEAMRNGNVECPIHKECFDISRRKRGRYVLILHKEYSDVDEVLRGGFYTFNRTDDAYQMIDKLRQKYFVCTRNEESYGVGGAEETLMAEAIIQTQERRGLKKFNRYYLKYMEMLKMLEREKYYFKIICDRVECIERELTLKKASPEKGKERAQFLINGMREVLRMRELLVSSHAFAYYLDDMGFNTDVVCRQQGEFEALIKTLMDMLVMPRREKPSELPPRLDITNLTLTCRRTRYGFMRVVINSIYKQDLFAAIKKENKKYPKCNFGSQDEGNKESNHAVSSAGAANQSGTVQRRKTYINSNHSWLESALNGEFSADEALPDTGIRPRTVKGCKKPKVRNPGKLKGDKNGTKSKPKNSQRSAFYKTPWRRVEIREKIPQATAESMENRTASCLSFVSHTHQDVNANGATALSMQQQKTDVGVTIGNVIQEADAKKSAHHSKTNGDLKDKRVCDKLFEFDFESVAKIAEDLLSRDTEEFPGEEVASFKPNRSEDGSCTNPGGLEVSFSPEKFYREEQLAGDPETNTYFDFDFEDEEEATEQSLKPIEKPGYPKRSTF